LPAEESDRKIRLIAFIVITLVFVVSVAALLYWAVNVAAARISARSTVRFQALLPRTTIAEEKAMLHLGNIVKLSSHVKVCSVF
jgi:hypothetical protein